MPNTKRLSLAPNYLTFSEHTKEVELIVHGECVFIFNAKEECTFTFYTRDKTDGLEFSLSSTEFVAKRIKTDSKFECHLKRGGLTTKSGAYYWVSLDSQNQMLHAGVGEPRIETARFSYDFDPNDKLWEANKMFLESLATIELPNCITPLRLLKHPITVSVPLLVKGMNELTMNDIAMNRALPSTSLPSAAQMLYGCVAGPMFILNTPDFPDFTNAIEHSIRTEGLWCNTRLKQKATEFGKDPQPLETYLRITLGQNNGESPGIPYVMEIWPVGHYSPVHNHSGANAVIRVLHGTIDVSLFPYLCDDEEGVEPFATKDFHEGDITWISSTLNQVHQLKNLETNETACMTIQCYMYDESDTRHYDYFDYLGNKNAKCQYEPDSDMDFLEFKNLMRREWDNRPRIFKLKPVKW
jgi:hypothetical protein